MNPVKIVNLRLSDQQLRVIQTMKRGITRPKNIGAELGIDRKAADTILRCIQRRNNITRQELHAMLPFVAPVLFRRQRRPTVYLEKGRWVARYFRRRTESATFIGVYTTEDEAIAAWRAYHAGRPLPPSPFARRSNSKPLIYLIRGRWKAQLWSSTDQKTISVGSFDTEDEAIAAWRHAKEHGVYTKNGWVKVA